MFKLVIVGALVTLGFASHHPINSEMVNKIRESTSKWQAHDVETNPLKDYTKEQLMGMLGTFILPSNKDYPGTTVVETPKEFDSRKQWAKFIHEIRD